MLASVVSRLSVCPPVCLASAMTAPQTGIVLLNLGGPATLDAVEPFLVELFADREIIQLPFQRWLGPFIARRRAPKVRKLYEGIGGGSPILHWTRIQGKALVARLDRLSPGTAPHQFYVAFRYARPGSEDALLAMARDGVTRAIAFTQYPQFSCATTGSSLNELWRTAERLGLESAFEWSVIDRWPVQDGFLDTMTQSTRAALEQIPAGERDDAVILFSAHSLPLSIINRGDPYPQEIGASVQGVIRRLGSANRYLLSYQSEVGPVRWQGPSTESVIRLLGARGEKNVVVVPIAFTSDHIETLSELDIEYAHVARTAGITRFLRAPAPNDHPRFLDAMAGVVLEHLAHGAPASRQYALHCPGCTNPHCRRLLNPVSEPQTSRITRDAGNSTRLATRSAS